MLLRYEQPIVYRDAVHVVAPLALCREMTPQLDISGECHLDERLFEG